MNQYCYIWKYIVKQDYYYEFEKYYSPEGEWIKLFKLASGYIRTELIRDKSYTARYITIDFWKSYEHFKHFRNKFKDQFESLD